MAPKRRQSRILSKEYVVRYRPVGSRAFERWTSLPEKREAIRQARRILVNNMAGKVEVKTAEGALLYQAHKNRQGRIVTEEL
jgi:hypothetical protein